jgi:hypothetical protein
MGMILFLYNETIHSQNLVPNPSFENYIDCPLCHTFLGAIESAYPWQSTFPLGGSTDYYNTCTFDDCETTIVVGLLLPNSMRQMPRTGNGMAGFITFDPADTSGIYDYKEYLQIELLTNLNTNTKYWFSCWVSLFDYSLYAIDKIQAYFSDTLVMFEPSLNIWLHNQFQPQVSNPEFRIITDTMNWVKVEGSFIANGNEKFLIIGNFVTWDEVNFLQVRPFPEFFSSDTIQKNYYFFDDVAVYEDDTPFYEADVGVADTCVARGTQLVLGGVARDEYLYWWYNKQGDLISTQSSIVVTANESTTYYLRQKDFKFDETIDSIYIKVGNCTEIPDYSGYDFAIYPNPNNGDFQVRFNTAVPDGAVLELYDLLGRKLAEYPLSGSGNIANINGIEVASAIYYATIVVPNTFRKSVKMVIMK